MRLTVIIPTTNGPVQVERITRLSRLPLSQVVTVDDFVPNPEMTRRYHALTDPAGPLRGLVGLENVRFELCLDRLPEMGRSWELPVAIAHWALDRGHELVSDAAEIVVWASGVVRPGRDIGEEDYHLRRKLDASRLALNQVDSGARMVILLPHARNEEIEEFRRESPDALIAGVYDVDAAIAVLERLIGAPAGKEAGPDTLRKWRWRPLGVAAVAAALLASAVVSLLTTSDTDRTVAPRSAVADGLAEGPTLAPDTSDVAAAVAPVADTPTGGAADAAEQTAPSLLLVEHRAMPGVSCIQVLLQQAPGVREEHVSVSGDFPASPVDGLCAISFEMPDAPVTAHLVLPDAFLSRVIPSDRNGLTGFSGLEGPYYRLIYPPEPLAYQFSLVGVGENDLVSFGHSLVAR